MTNSKLSRRDAIVRTGVLMGTALAARKVQAGTGSEAASQRRAGRPFRYCLNTATIRGQKLGIVKEVEVAAQAGYDAIEPWADAIELYARNGGDLKELHDRIQDSGLTVEGTIAFAQWLVDDRARRAEGIEQAKREMELAARIGARRFAAPPAGATGLPRLDLGVIAERYRVLLEAAGNLGIVPELELWGFSKNLSRLGECVCVAMETGHPKACVLADVFHLYKGGSQIEGLHLLGPDAVQVLHINDYPSEPPREKINDSYRVYPGDGVAPLAETLRLLHQTGGQKVLSLELFSRRYWEQDPLVVASTGLAKMKVVVERADL